MINESVNFGNLNLFNGKGDCLLAGVRAVVNAHRRISPVGFIISKGSEGSGSSPAPSGIGILAVLSPLLGREDAPRRLWRKDGFILWRCFRRAEAAGAHPPGPRATSR